LGRDRPTLHTGLYQGSRMPAERAYPGQFVHLHLHTEYSLLDGGNRVGALVERVAELGMKSVAVTDHGNLFGAVSFYQACRDAGLRPILGVEAYVTPPGKARSDRTYTGGGEGGYHLVLLAETLEGWRNLMYLCSEAYLTGFYYKPRMDRELLEKHCEGLIAINGHLGSEIGEHLLAFARSNDRKFWDAAVESAQWHDRVFNRRGHGQVPPPHPRFYLELQHHVPEQIQINPHIIRLARELGIPLVCDNDAHFLRAEDHDTHDTLICISTGKGKDDTDRLRYSPELYVKSPGEMEAIFLPYGEAGVEALDNTVRIAERCNVELPLGENHAPAVRIAVPDASSLPRWDEARFEGDLTRWYAAYCACFDLRPFERAPSRAELAEAKANCDRALRMLAEAGFRWRYGRAPEPEGPRADNLSARLHRELRILADKNISAYFLIVWDFVNWGRQRGIPANARGSGVGTMVGYVLGLSNACPVKYGLLFERFTDPDRAEYPDIDIDLCQDGRGAVIDYVRRKYGHVAQIITFGTLKARAAIRDVGRVLNMPLPDVDRIAKLVPEQLNITIEEALRQEPELERLRESDDRCARLLDHAMRLEGHTRHAGVHAAGVIVATRALHEIVPLYRQPGSPDNEIITQWDGPTCERMGLLKMDFLGLRTLSTIERARTLIRETLPEEEIWRAVGREKDSHEAGAHPLDLDRLTFDDQKVFDLFRRGETTGVFQFESPGMRRLLMEMRPDRLEDLIAANALFRPGPMDLIPDYNRRKHGHDVVPRIHEIVDRHTAETYGVMVYQEQVMQIVHELGGIGLRDAYTLIKNISKKKHDKIDKERPRFVAGAQKKGLSKQQAEELFELILKFAGYGFNKSHSTGYAIIAYQTAYLKTYFPNHYMAAFLTYESQAGKTSDWIPYLEDCRRTRFIDPHTGRTLRTGVEVRPPDINLSEAEFAVVFEQPGPGLRAHEGHVRFGLKGIKGVGDKAVEAIIAERRANGPFTSLFDFCERMPPGVVNKGALEALIKSGTFDGVHGRAQRAAMVAGVEQALAAGARAAQDRAMGQAGLFAHGSSARVPVGPPPLPKVEPWSEAELLRLEKETLGFYLSTHPLDKWRAWGQVFATHTVGQVRDLDADTRVVLFALVNGVRHSVVRNGRTAGQKMGVLTLEDQTGACEAVVFPAAFVRYGHLARTEQVLFVLGRVDRQRGEGQIVVDRLAPIDGVPVDGGRLRVFVDEARLNGQAEPVMEDVAALLVSAASRPPPATDGNEPRFGVDVCVGVDRSVVILAADPRLRVVLTPELVEKIETALGPGMVRVSGSIAVDRAEPARFRRARDES
jgi:DNA polymerase-3 subunit alpha